MVVPLPASQSDISTTAPSASVRLFVTLMAVADVPSLYTFPRDATSSVPTVVSAVAYSGLYTPYAGMSIRPNAAWALLPITRKTLFDCNRNVPGESKLLRT